jgi:hypothetical protein
MFGGASILRTPVFASPRNEFPAFHPRLIDGDTQLLQVDMDCRIRGCESLVITPEPLHENC